jgi:hypothetical protein
MAHPRHELVRQRYGFRCGYCGVSETETGGELMVDHHRPIVAGGTEDDENLVYACFRCNSYKHDFTPTPADVKLGLRILHPRVDAVDHHCREDNFGRLEPTTPTGRFHIELLRLNRPQLILRRLRDLLTELHRASLVENESLRMRVAILEQYLVELKRRQADDEKP